MICAQVWSAQLNEAEYAPLLTAVLLYLNSEGVAAPLASTLAVGGQVIYFWLRAFVGHYLCETPRARHRADAATGATSHVAGVGGLKFDFYTGHYHEGGMDPPPYAPFAVVRYIALGLLVQELRALTA